MLPDNVMLSVSLSSRQDKGRLHCLMLAYYLDYLGDIVLVDAGTRRHNKIYDSNAKPTVKAIKHEIFLI